jgi:FMN phosphatase YigB (HAD superfamily)
MTELQRVMDPVPSVVILDLDDTLCDYSSARETRLRIAFSKALEGANTGAAPPDLEGLIQESIQLQPHGTDHFSDLLAKYGVDRHEAAISAEWFRANRFHGLQLFPEAVSVLRSLRGGTDDGPASRMRRVGIVTNGPKDVQRAKLRHLSLAPLIDFAVISEEFGLAKPDPAIFHEALRLADARPDEAVVVGDSPEFDIAGAQRTGIRSVWLNRCNLPWQVSRERPTFEIQSLSELAVLLGSGRE